MKFLHPETLMFYSFYFFLQLMMDMAVRNCVGHSYNLATSLHRVAKCVGYQGSRQLMQKDGNYAICVLIPRLVKFPGARRLCSDLADLMTMDEKDMLLEYFHFICPHLLINETEASAKKCLIFVENTTNTSRSELMGKSFMVRNSVLDFYSHRLNSKYFHWTGNIQWADASFSHTNRRRYQTSRSSFTVRYGIWREI